MPTLEDTAAVSRINNKDTCLGEGDGVAKIGKWSQTYEGVGERGMMWPCMAAGGSEGTKASVALATDLSGSLFATLTKTVGDSGLRFATGALDEK